MKEQSLAEISLEKLNKMVGMYRGITYALGFMLLTLLGMSLYLIIGLGKTAMISLAVVPLAMLPILLMSANKIKQLKQEIENRKF